MSSHRTCMPCRTKKVKCDGQLGQCGPCARARVKLHCTYDPFMYVDVRPNKPSLRRGAACAQCRKKKKRCNGARPFCDVCHNSGDETECRYDEKLSINRIQGSNMRRLRKIASAISKPVTPNTDFSAPEFPAPDPCHSDEHIEPSSMALVLASTTLLPPSLSDEYIELSSMALVRVSTIPSPQSLEAEYSLSSSETLSFQHIQDPYDFIGAFPQESVQFYNGHQTYYSDPYVSALSEISMTDMDMTFRLMFLSHRSQIGFRFTAAKQEAIVFGDFSQTVIHPFFIYFAQLFGSNLYQERKEEYCYLYTMCIYLRLTREAMATMREEDDPLSYAEACHLMSLFCAYNHNSFLGKQYFLKAIETIKAHDIRFVVQSSGDPAVPRSSSWPYCSEESGERVVFLSQVIYLHFHFHLITGVAEDVVYDLRQQFLKELPVCYPDAFKMCPILARVRTMVVGTEATLLVASYMVGRISPSWFSSCHAWILSMDPHIDSLVVQLAYYERARDHDNWTLLRYNCCICLVMLSEVDKILKRLPYCPNAPISSGCLIECDQVLNKITIATEGMMQRNDLTIMALLFKTSCLSTSMVGSSRMSSRTEVTVMWPRLKPGSIFHNTTLMLMGQSQNKLASVVIEPTRYEITPMRYYHFMDPARCDFESILQS